MAVITTIEGIKKQIGCVGCAIQRGEIQCTGGVIAETENFAARQDFEIPIPGFIIVSSKKHIKGIDDLSKEQRTEFIEFLFHLRKAMKEVLNIDYIYLIQEEDAIVKGAHFHIWLFPKYQWVEELGRGMESLRKVMEYTRKNMKTKVNLEKVKQAAESLKGYLAKY
jgi:diadenosine tetraphosphate (Ap4A) HIT family hydrolase